MNSLSLSIRWKLFQVKYYLVVVLLLCVKLCFSQAGNKPLVTINSLPISACKGQPVKFTATITNSGTLPVYQWQVNGVNAGSNQNTFTSTSLSNADVIECSVSFGLNGAGGMVNSNKLTITVISPPQIIQQDMAICPGSTVVLQADVSGAAYAKYKPVDFANQFNFNIAQNPIATSIFNCPTGNVSFNGVPFILHPWSDVYTGWNAYFATGNDPRNLQIPVNEDGVVGINILANTYYGRPGPTSYVKASFWANGVVVYHQDLIGDEDIRDFNRSSYTNNINNTTTVNAWQSPSGQTRLDNVHIQMPVPTRIDSIVFNDNGGNGQRIFIMAATVEKKPLSLKWSTGETTSSITVNPTQPTTYSIMANNGVANCGSSINISMTTPLVPSVTISESAGSVCSGSATTFTAVPVNGGDTPAYQWQVNGANEGTNDAMFTTNTLADGDLVKCLMTSNSPCITTPTVTSNAIAASVLPLPQVDAGNDIVIHYGDHTQLNATVTGDVQFMQWSPADGLDDVTVLKPVANPLTTTKYTLFVQTKNTCTASATVTVKVLPLEVVIPNAISPNHDGVNDVWDIKHLNEFATCTVKIFNRYGQQLFSSVGYAQPWNGTYKNKRLPPATYYYVIDLKDGSRIRSGYVEVIY
ncbi:gliding motility-associated C-terminal domain-containing protein [Mucilaginibacter flavus]|uniref:T9SS type B sorting domain-containing protein n=1 Tax=Mucilaginibacter flavus TaxID=931504 RepID=UPI0025B38209|nr:gliding motility-associated C-terminal domain-containing protein [Mucilaginibacter flavus]MDN3579925.1 gliding motility-associated C-terminal domain-containing protein [Mucilaginibacter flavus]